MTSVDKYLDAIDSSNLNEKQKDRISSELAVLQRNIDAAINAIEADPTVQYCMTGRQVQGMKDMKLGRGQAAPRFPELTKQMRLIIGTSALKKAKDNYYKKYDELNEQMLKDYATMGERMAEIAGENALDVRREFARQACVSFAEASSLPKSPAPSKGVFGKIVGTALVAATITAGIVATPFTGGASLAASIALTAAMTTATAVGIAGMSGGGPKNGLDASQERELMGSKQLNQWNYKETITTTFNWDTLVCQKCTRSQHCKKTGNPLFGSKYCKAWEEEKSSCTDTQF